MIDFKNLDETYKLYMPGYTSKNKLLLTTFIISSIIFVILYSVVAPFYIGKLISNFNNPMKYFYCIIIIYVFVFIFYYINQKKRIEIFPSFVTYSRKQIFKSIIDKYKENYETLKMGSTISKINTMTWYFQMYFQSLLTEILPHFILLISLCVVFLVIDLKIGLILLLNIICMNYFIMNSKKNCEYKKKANDYYYIDVDNKLVDIYTSLINTYLNNNTIKDKQSIDKIQNNYHKLYKESSLPELSLTYTLTFINISLFIFILFYLIKINIKNEKKIIFTLLLIYFFNSSFLLCQKIPQMFPAYCSIIETNEYIRGITKTNKNKGNRIMKSGSVEFKNVSFKYKKKYIFNNLNLSIKDKEKIAIIGRSGTGKTTLILILLKLYNYKGKILVGNQNIQEIDVDYLRKKIIYCNQTTILYDMTVLENIKLNYNVSNDYVISLLNKYKLMELFDNLPLSIQNNSGILGSNLSGGMQKIVLIIRAVLRILKNRPYVVIFDEPLTSLDSVTKDKVINLIMDVCKNITLIVITHDKEIVPYMDRKVNLGELN